MSGIYREFTILKSLQMLWSDIKWSLRFVESILANESSCSAGFKRIIPMTYGISSLQKSLSIRTTALMCGESASILRNAAVAFAEETAVDMLEKVAASDPQNRKCWIQVE
jgi:hypothetical protein